MSVPKKSPSSRTDCDGFRCEASGREDTDGRRFRITGAHLSDIASDLLLEGSAKALEVGWVGLCTVSR